MIISPDQRTIYVAGFYNSGDRGVVYAFDVASGAKKGEATFPGNSIPQSITLNGNTLFVAVSTPFVSVDNIDYSAAQKGVATCTIDASGSVASCGNIVNLPEAIHGATDVEVYNNAVYAVGRKADGSGVVFKLGKAQAAQPQADPTATPTSTPSPSPTQSPSPTVVPTTTTAPTVTVTAVPTATVTPTTNATRAPQATATSTPTRTPTTVPTSGVGTTVVPTNTPPQVTPVDLPSTGITDGPVALYLSIGLLLVSLIAFTRRNV
jgi:hypothetical protein